MSEHRTVDKINVMGFEEFMLHFGNIVEEFPGLTAALWVRRPFHSIDNIHQCLGQMIDELPVSLKVGILRVSPDLGGHMAEQGQLSPESEAEHKYAGLNSLSLEEKTHIRQLNQQYKNKFDFPFVICVRENIKKDIINGMRARLGNSKEQELARAVDELKKIAYYRIMDVVASIHKSKL